MFDNDTTEDHLFTYVVCDSAGKKHTVRAHYVAQPGAIAVHNFIRKDRPNMGIVASFTAPRSVTEA